MPLVLVVFSTDRTIAAAIAAVKDLISVREGKKELTWRNGMEVSTHFHLLAELLDCLVFSCYYWTFWASSKLKRTPPKGAPKAVLTPAAAAAEKSSRRFDSFENLRWITTKTMETFKDSKSRKRIFQTPQI